MFIIVSTTWGVIDCAAVRMTEDEALELSEKMAEGMDPEKDDVRVFHFPLPVRHLELSGEGTPFYAPRV